MSKKYNNNYNKKPAAGFTKTKNVDIDFLDREDCDEVHFMSFTPEDFPGYENDNQDDQELIFILKRICASYKHVLTLEFKSFWSTLKYNNLLRRSLNSFLQYSTRRRFQEYNRKGHENQVPSTNDSEVKLILKEISRLVLTIFYRIANCDNENMQKSQEFGCQKLILDEWLLDLPKMLDIIAIYGEKNPKIVKELIRIGFESQKEFQADFDELQDNILKEFLDRSYKEILMLKKKDRLGSSGNDVSDADIERKMELLCSLLDTTSSILDILQFFPEPEREKLLLDDKINLIMENLFYELIFAREEAWVMGKYRGDIILVADVVLSKFVDFFSIFFNLMIKVFEDKQLVKQSIGKKMITQWNKYIKELGKVQSFGKKQGENRYWYLIEYTSDQVDFARLFSSAPEDNSEAYQLFQIQVQSVIDERKRNVIAYEEKKLQHEQQGGDEKGQYISNADEVPEIKFVEQSISQEELQKQDQIAKKEAEYAEKKRETERKKKEEEEKELAGAGYQEKEEVLTVYQKGAMKVNMKMSEEEEKKYKQRSMWLAIEYEDEPDDSHHYFQPAVGGRQAATNDANEEDEEEEGEEFDENGNKLPPKQQEEGYDDGKRRKNEYQPRPRDLQNSKPNTHDSRLKNRPFHPRQNTNKEGNQTGNQFAKQSYTPKDNSQRQGQQDNNNANQYQKKPQYRDNTQNNNYNNSNNNNNYQAKGNTLQSGQSQQPKKQYKKEDGFSGSEDEQRPQKQNFNREGGNKDNYKNKSSGNQPQQQKQQQEANPQKNILKKKYKD